VPRIEPVNPVGIFEPPADFKLSSADIINEPTELLSVRLTCVHAAVVQSIIAGARFAKVRPHQMLYFEGLLWNFGCTGKLDVDDVEAALGYKIAGSDSIHSYCERLSGHTNQRPADRQSWLAEIFGAFAFNNYEMYTSVHAEHYKGITCVSRISQCNHAVSRSPLQAIIFTVTRDETDMDLGDLDNVSLNPYLPGTNMTEPTRYVVVSISYGMLSSSAEGIGHALCYIRTPANIWYCRDSTKAQKLPQVVLKPELTNAHITTMWILARADLVPWLKKDKSLA